MEAAHADLISLSFKGTKQLKREGGRERGRGRRGGRGSQSRKGGSGRVTDKSRLSGGWM